MVFLANEPSNTNYFQNITNFSDLKSIAYPADAFNSNAVIPMMQVIKEVEVLAGGKVKLGEGTLKDINEKPRSPQPEKGLYGIDAETETLVLRLDRLATRINVLLQSPYDLDPYFEGITLSELPTKVPLFWKDYAIARDAVGRSIAADKFTTATPTETGMVWAKKLDRIVMPSLNLKPEDKNNEDEAVVFTVRFGGNKYSPSTKLRTPRSDDENNYSLPYNTWLKFEGTVKEVLEVNIKAEDWTDVLNNWTVPEHLMLNVSHTEISITDFNGARISFWSNMPVVRVLDKVVKTDNTGDLPAGIYDTNHIFNSIASQLTQDGTTVPARFQYVTNYGTGYMDLLVDGWRIPNSEGDKNHALNLTGTYVLTLSAENVDGSNALQREITVNVAQHGLRTIWSDPINAQAYDKENKPSGGSRAFVGAFWKNNEKGERIIMGQIAQENATIDTPLSEWSAEVQDAESANWVILSTTPSFDPNVGTNNPGNPEDYLVIPNAQKGEYGQNVSGKGRIYFRIGLTSVNPNSPDINGFKKPRYARVKVNYRLWGWDKVSTIIYVRQGEDPDNLYEHSSASARFSVYNVTHVDFKTTPDAMNDFSYRVDQSSVGNPKQPNGYYTAHVDYPTQGGAHFQWARIKKNEGKDYPYKSYSPDQDPNNPNYVPDDKTAYMNFGYRALSPNADLNAMDTGTSTFYSRGWGWGVYNNGQRPSTGGWNNYLIWDNQISNDSYKTEHEICPAGYHRPHDGIYKEGIDPPRHKTTVEAETSEWRASIFTKPIIGDGNGKFNDPANYDNQYGVPYYEPKPLPENLIFGLYADGYFDRLPLELKNVNTLNTPEEGGAQYGVRLNKVNAAHWGTVAVNGNKSLFFPAVGRRNYGTIYYGRNKGVLQYPDMGYYMTASPADIAEEIPKDGSIYYPDYSNIWTMQINYVAPSPVSDSFKNGYSLRCVKD